MGCSLSQKRKDDKTVNKKRALSFAQKGGLSDAALSHTIDFTTPPSTRSAALFVAEARDARPLDDGYPRPNNWTVILTENARCSGTAASTEAFQNQ
jgi:hypothetical protein